MGQFEEDTFLLAATGGTGHTCDLYVGSDYEAYLSCQACAEEERRDRVKDEIKKRVNNIEDTEDDIFEIAKKEKSKWQEK